MSGNEMTGKSRTLRRRTARVPVAAAGLGAGWPWPRRAQHIVGDFDLESSEDPRDVRRIAAGETSGIPNPFFGLEALGEQDEKIPEEAVRADLCTGLFGGLPPAGVVPTASFSDYNCPFCLSRRSGFPILKSGPGGVVRIT